LNSLVTRSHNSDGRIRALETIPHNLQSRSPLSDADNIRAKTNLKEDVTDREIIETLVATGYMSNQTAWFENDLFYTSKYNKPECVVYDPLLDRYIVANVGNGTIVETDTTNHTSYWVTGYERIYGMCIDGNILYTSNGDTLLGFHLLTGELEMSLPISNLNNLDGMTVDGNGFLYVIDTGGRLIKVDLEQETYEILTPGGLPDFPQDCVFDPFNNRIVVAAFQQSAPIVAVDPESGEVTTLTTLSAGYYDGITIDQYGNFYFSSFVAGGRVYKYPNDCSTRSVIASQLGEPTGLNYNQFDNILAVPSFNKDTVFFFHIGTTGIDDPGTGNLLEFDIFPNPCEDVLHIRYPIIDIRNAKLEVINMSGTALKSISPVSTGGDDISIDMGDLPSGIYLVRLSANNKTAVKKVVVI